MRSAITISALLVALGGGLGLVAAQHHRTTGNEAGAATYAAIVDDYDNETTGSIINLAAAPRLALSDEQKGFVFLGVINLRDVPEVAMQAPEPGVPLPLTVDLHEIPAMVAQRIPAVHGYKFVKLEDRILLVSEHTRQVEVMIPRYKLMFHQ